MQKNNQIITKEKSINFPKLFKGKKGPSSMFPVLYVSTGSNVYGLSNTQNDEYAGIHFTSTLNYLQHPDFKVKTDILRLSYNDKYNLVLEDHPERLFGITSFEISKFISLYTRSSIVVYDILYLSPMYVNPEMIDIVDKLKEGITNRIGLSAKTYVLNNWQKDRTNQKRIIMSYYRLLQAITFLRDEEYVSDASALWEEFPKFHRFTYGKELFQKFKNSDFEKIKLTEREITGTARELEDLIDEVNKASITTRLPDTSPKDILSSLLSSMIQKRLNFINED